MMFHSENQKVFIEKLTTKIASFYNEQLVSLAIFGSYAREEAKLNSDLDLLIILRSLPFGRMRAQWEFVSEIEIPLDAEKDALKRDNIDMEISSLLLARSGAESFLPIYLDMVQYCYVLKDCENFLKNRLLTVSEQMKRWGSKRVDVGGHWAWEICPALKWGEVINYDK